MIPHRPCIGCGYCCSKVRCALGASIHGAELGPCPSLHWDGARHWCGLVLNAAGAARERLQAELAIGAGCCSPLNSLRRQLLADRAAGEASAPLAHSSVARPCPAQHRT